MSTEYDGWNAEMSDSASQANTVEMVNTPMFVDDMMYAPYDQRTVDDIDDYKPPYNVRMRKCTELGGDYVENNKTLVSRSVLCHLQKDNILSTLECNTCDCAAE